MVTQCRIPPVSVRTAAVRGGWWRGVLVLLLLGGAGSLRAGAADSDLRDLQHEVAVRAALAKDSRLETLNLIVRVKDRIATLSGPVPSRELARRALETAKRVPELRDVRDKMTVQFEEQGLMLPLPLSSSKAGVSHNVKPLPAAEPPPSIPAASKTQSQPLGGWMPVPLPPVAGPPNGALVPWKVGLLPGPGEAVSRPKDVTLGKPAESLDSAAIASAVQSLMQGEERYRRLRFEVKDGKVILAGVVYRWADLQELARAVTRIPGVNAVVLREIKTEATK